MFQSYIYSALSNTIKYKIILKMSYQTLGNMKSLKPYTANSYFLSYYVCTKFTLN